MWLVPRPSSQQNDDNDDNKISGRAGLPWDSRIWWPSSEKSKHVHTSQRVSQKLESAGHGNVIHWTFGSDKWAARGITAVEISFRKSHTALWQSLADGTAIVELRTWDFPGAKSVPLCRAAEPFLEDV